MRYYSFEVVVEKEPEDEGYLAYSPTMPGVFSNGKTVKDAHRNIREAITQHIDVLREKVERGLKSIDNGKGIPHEQVRNQFATRVSE